MISPQFYSRTNLIEDVKGRKVFPAKQPAFNIQGYEYTLKEGETFMLIAERLFGQNTADWTLLTDINRPRRQEDWKAGDKIILPINIAEKTSNKLGLKKTRKINIGNRWAPLVPIVTILEGIPSLPTDAGIITVEKIVTGAGYEPYEGVYFPGAGLYYQITITNTSATVDYLHLEVVDTFPSGVTVSGSTPAPDSITTIGSGELYRWYVDVPRRTAVTIRVAFFIDSGTGGDTIENTASALKPDGTTVSDTFSFEVVSTLDVDVMLYPVMKITPLTATVPATEGAWKFKIEEHTGFINVDPLEASWYTANWFKAQTKDEYLVLGATEDVLGTSASMTSKQVTFEVPYTAPLIDGSDVFVWNIPEIGTGHPYALGSAPVLIFGDGTRFARYVPLIILDPATQTPIDFLIADLLVEFVSTDGVTVTLRVTRSHAAITHPDITIDSWEWYVSSGTLVADPGDPSNLSKRFLTASPGEYAIGVLTKYNGPSSTNMPVSQRDVAIKIS